MIGFSNECILLRQWIMKFLWYNFIIYNDIHERIILINGATQYTKLMLVRYYRTNINSLNNHSYKKQIREIEILQLYNNQFVF